MNQNTLTLHRPWWLPLALFCLLCAALTPPPTGSAARAPAHPARAAYDCQGDACSVTALVWEEEGQRFRADNSSGRRVRVTVETFAGESAVVVEPQKSEYLRVKTFNGPYRAAFE
jgi:hypothetical protein